MENGVKEKKIVESLVKLYTNQIEQEKCILRCDSISIKFWQMELNSLLNDEPFYMFKKKHKKWEEKVKETKEHLYHLYKKFDDTFKELKEFQNDLKQR